MAKLIAASLVLTIFVCTMAQRNSRMNSQSTLSSGYWSLEKSQPLIDKTQTIRLSPDLSQLTEGERKAVEKLLAVGRIFQQLYEEQRHQQALTSFHDLTELDKKMRSPAATQNLLTLYRLFQGPIATTLDNQREPFLPVEPVTPGKNMYPRGTTKALLSTPSLRNKDELLAARTVVRVARANNLREDINRLLKYP